MKPVKAADNSSLRDKLLVGQFGTTSPQLSALSDPLEPVQMVRTLDELRPYEHNPRVTKNEKYEEIKESIRNRGLDSPPPITRRPGEQHFIVSNGGNTRLTALNELWQETRDEKYFKIHCLFKPWPKRGDIVALTGHMAENDIRGNLLWIERCLGVAKAKEFYKEEDGGKDISQSELSRRLATDGYPIDRSHISRMEQTLLHLFPFIPNVLWNGMGVDGVRTLLTFRSNAEKAWNKLVQEKGVPANGIDFDQVFSNTLCVYDEEPGGYVFNHFKDDLLGAMTDALRENGVSYELILFEIEVAQDPRQARPLATVAPTSTPETQPPSIVPGQVQETHIPPSTQHPLPPAGNTGGRAGSATVGKSPTPPQEQVLKQVPVLTAVNNEPGSTVVSIPVQAGGLAPVSDIWAIYPQQDSIAAIRNLADLLALEIATWAGVIDFMRSTQDQGLGFTLRRPETFTSAASETTWQLLASLSGNSPAEEIQPVAPDDLAELLIQHLPDDLVIKAFRMIRLARRAKELTGEK
ncbi:hypothetical protein BVH03_17590 [Pseudomonas sp. PA15(2017)]|uniref:ParB family protein n=1 Tax=Pseudomonas sp. PA15(2017) TaxID=1932111 RepID=UPI000967E051|nr:ParB family protein [Pseudomonas sp. PA15(2017)]OLU25469.1 hypothetical protein BVH03_17590 [Pseudomonas sp. PA15(2017)]